jgi:hypothetical protein
MNNRSSNLTTSSDIIEVNMVGKSLFDVLFNNNTFSSKIKPLSIKTFEEEFDENKLVFIINNNEKLNLNGETIKQLTKYLKSSNNGLIKVKYHQKDNGLHGRHFANNSNSAQSMKSDIRQTIFNEKYYDVDMINSYPNIIYWLSGFYDLNNAYLGQYTQYRDDIINDLIEANPTMTRYDIKQLFLSINNGGSKDYNGLKNKTPFLVNYFNEFNEIRKVLSECFESVREKVINNNLNEDYKYDDLAEDDDDELKDKDNINGKVLTYICMYVENQILMHLIDFLKKETNIQIKNSILIFDGIMVKKNLTMNLSHLIKKFEMYIHKLGFVNFKLSIKEMDKVINLEALGYDKSISYVLKSKNDEIIKNIEKPVIPCITNTFDEEEYCFNDLCTFIDNNTFLKEDGIYPELDTYLINNLHRCLRIVNENVFIKENNKEYFIVKKLKDFSCQIIQSYSKNSKGVKIEVPENLTRYILKRKKFFKLYNSVETNFNFNNPNQNTFIACRRFAASINPKPYKMEDFDILFDLMKNKLMSGSDVHFNFELDKLSCMVNSPERKTGIVTILISKQGTGKNTYTDFLCNKLFGKYNTISNMSGIDKLVEDKNADHIGKKLIVVNEMSATREQFLANFDKLKGHVTEENQRFRPLFANAYYSDTSTCYYLLSNKLNSFVLESKTDRRPHFLDICEEQIGDSEYFTMLNEHLTQELADKFYQFLVDRAITFKMFKPMTCNIPRSEMNNIVYEISNSHNIFLDFINEFKDTTETDEVKLKVKTTDLYSKYTDFCYRYEIKPCTKNKFATEMLKLHIKRHKTNTHYYFEIIM